MKSLPSWPFGVSIKVWRCICVSELPHGWLVWVLAYRLVDVKPEPELMLAHCLYDPMEHNSAIDLITNKKTFSIAKYTRECLAHVNHISDINVSVTLHFDVIYTVCHCTCCAGTLPHNWRHTIDSNQNRPHCNRFLWCVFIVLHYLYSKQ